MCVFKLNQTTQCDFRQYAGNYFHIISATMLRFGSVMTGAADLETGVVLYSYFLYDKRDKLVIRYYFLLFLSQTLM